MEFGIVNRFVLHTLQRNITHLAVITLKTNIKLGTLKGGNWKTALIPFWMRILSNVLDFWLFSNFPHIHILISENKF